MANRYKISILLSRYGKYRYIIDNVAKLSFYISKYRRIQRLSTLIGPLFSLCYRRFSSKSLTVSVQSLLKGRRPIYQIVCLIY